ncbi:MAG: hypothetical protein U0354_14180 [Candidatus Sericytochromatia bacterium]
MSNIYYIDDQEVGKTGLVVEKLKKIIDLYNNESDIKQSCRFIPLIGIKSFDSVLEIQNGNIEGNSLVFLDADLSYFNDPNNSSRTDIKTSEIIKAVTKKESKVIMISQYQKSDYEYGGKSSNSSQWYDKYNEEGAFSYIHKDELLSIDLSNKNNSEYLSLKRLIYCSFNMVKMSEYKISLGIEGQGMYVKLIDNYSKKELGKINNFINVSINDLLGDNIEVIGVNGARVVLFRMMFELALLPKSQLIISPKDIYKTFRDPNSELNSLISVINTKEIPKFNINGVLTKNKTEAKKNRTQTEDYSTIGKYNRKFEVSNIEIEKELLKKYEEEKIKLNKTNLKSDTSFLLNKSSIDYEKEIHDLKKLVTALTERCKELEALNPAKINIQNLQNQINKLKG